MPGTLSRIAAQDGMGPMAFLTWRAGVGAVAIALLAAALLARGGLRIPAARDISRADRSTLIVLVLFSVVVNVAMFLAFTRTTIGVAMICFYTYPALVTLGAVRFFGERIDRRRAAALVLGFGGLFLVLVPSIVAGGAAVDPLGVGLALVASVLQAANVLLIGRGLGPIPTVVTGLVLNLVPGICFAILAIAVGETPFPLGLSTDRVAVIAIFSGVIGSAMPTLANLAGIGIIGPARTAILMLFEAVVAVTMAAIFLSQQPAPIQVLGGVAVLLSGALLQTPRRGERLVVEAVHPTV